MRQYQQLLASLNNDWIDNHKDNQRVIDNIIKKIEEAIWRHTDPMGAL